MIVGSLILPYLDVTMSSTLYNEVLFPSPSRVMGSIYYHHIGVMYYTSSVQYNYRHS